MSIKIDKSLILNEIKSHYLIKTDADFARFLGIKPQTLSSWYSRNTMDVDVVYAKCRDINPEFILSGRGDIARQIFTNGLSAPALNPGSEEIGGRFKQIREQNSYSSKDFSERISIDSSQYSKIELGKLAPTLAQCITVCGVFSVSMDWLVFGVSSAQSSDVATREVPANADLLTNTLLENAKLLREIIELKDQLHNFKRPVTPYPFREETISKVAEP